MLRSWMKATVLVMMSVVGACGGSAGGPEDDVSTIQQELNRPEFNGMRMNFPGSDGVYLIMGGQKRGIPTDTIYNRLFRNWNGIVGYWDISQIDDGPSMDDNTYLMLSPAGALFLYTNGRKHGIPSPSIRDRYNFDTRKALVLPNAVLNTIPDGFMLF